MQQPGRKGPVGPRMVTAPCPDCALEGRLDDQGLPKRQRSFKTSKRFLRGAKMTIGCEACDGTGKVRVRHDAKPGTWER